MPFPFDKYPWLNFQELNLAYFIKHFREIFQQWDTLLHEMYDWKDATDAELAEWKSTVEAGISSWESGLQQSMEDWKDETEADISAWEAATLSALDAWKTATTAVFEQIRTEAAASAQAAAGSAASAQTALAGAQAAQAAAEAAAAGIQSELTQIQTNTADIADLKTQLHHLGNAKNLLWISPLTENKYYYDSPTPSTSYSYFAINVENGKTYKSATHIRFISRPGAVISDTDTDTYTATADETLYFTLYNESRSNWAICESTVDINTVGTYDAPTLNNTTLAQTTGQSKSKVMSQKAVVDAVGIVNTNANKVSADNDIIETMAVPSPNLYKPILSGYLLNYETGNPIASASFETSDFIPVKPGDEIHYQFDYGGIRRDSINYSGYSTMYIVCAYRYDKSYITDSYATNATSYTVPADAEYIRVSLSITTTFTNRALIKSITTDIIPYFEPNEVAYINPKYLTPKDEYKHFSGAYSDEIKFRDLETSAKAMILNAVMNFDTLPVFELGIKNASNTLFRISVDASKLYVYDYAFGGASSTTTEYTHGLTIGKDLAVSAIFNNKGVKVSICSGGEKYEIDNFLQITRAGLGFPYFVVSSGTVDYVSVSASAKDVNRYIWLFGDSYLSDASDRWAYYLNQSGVDTYMIDAYPGEDSAKSLKSLQNLLKIGHPSYIVWCLGMNDGTDSDAPRPAWKSAFDEVKRLCSIYEIEMIAATIPTVPSINNEYKNAYVKDSGLRYIDFAKAVGASPSGVWYDGMLDTDNVHPTAKGAKTLYYTAITDFQQLQIKNH